MEAYKIWVRRNRDYVNSFESLANGLTWLLPERFSDSEIGPEAVTSIVGIVTAINEHIINTTPKRTPTESAVSSSFPYSLCITLLKDLETLVEVAAQQFFGEDRKWNFIAVIEATKVLARLAVFRNSGYKMLLQGGETLNTQHGHGDGYLTKVGLHPGNYNGQNARNLEGRARSALSRFGENARMVSDPTWSQRVQQQYPIMEPPALTDKIPTVSSFLSEKGHLPGCLFLMAEVMFVARPLIYVLLIRKYRGRSWLPWFISLAFDLTSMGILSYVTTSKRCKQDQPFLLSDLEKNEMRRRKVLWALYVMRDPFFSEYTRQKLESSEKTLEPVPFVSLLAGKLVELLIGAQTRYTYMSGS